MKKTQRRFEPSMKQPVIGSFYMYYYRNTWCVAKVLEYLSPDMCLCLVSSGPRRDDMMAFTEKTCVPVSAIQIEAPAL